MAPRIKAGNKIKGAAAYKPKAFALTDTAKELILRDRQAVANAQAQLNNTLITLAAGAGVPDGVTITNVDMEAGKVHYMPTPPLAKVADGPDA